MSTKLTGSIQALLNLKMLKITDTRMSNPVDSVNYTKNQSITAGVASGQMDEMYHRRGTLAESADVSLDLSGTAIQNSFGENIALAKLRLLYIENTSVPAEGSPTPSDMEVSGTLLEGFGLSASEVIIIKPGGFLLLAAPNDGYTVTNTTQDTLTLAHDTTEGDDIAYRVLVGGTKT